MTTTAGPDNAAFVGFVAPSERTNLSVSYYACPSGYQFASSSTYNGCCPVTSVSCAMATTCMDGTLSFVASTSSCQVGSSCQSQLLVPSAQGPTTTAYFCGTPPKFGKTLYRADPAKITSPPTGGPSGTTFGNSTTPSSSPSFTYGPAPGTPPPPPPSRAWIAGAVLGPFALATLLWIGVYLCLRRRWRWRRRRHAGAGGASEEGTKSVRASSQEDVSFYYNQDMKIDPRASQGPWSPYSSGYGSLRRGNNVDGRASQESRHELAADRSTQVYIELPAPLRPSVAGISTDSIESTGSHSQKGMRRQEGGCTFHSRIDVVSVYPT